MISEENSSFNISVAAFIYDNGKVLLTQRANDESFLAGYWELFGGGVEKGETMEEAVVREVKEESGLIVTAGKKYCELSFDDACGHHKQTVAFYCILEDGHEIILNNEHQVYQWVTVDELDNKKPIADHMCEIIKKGFEFPK